MMSLTTAIRSWIRSRSSSLSEDVGAQAVIEFALSLPFLVMMSIGTFSVGMTIDRFLTMGQLVRTGGNMFARGLSFTSDQNKQFLVDAATGMNMTLTGGDAGVYLSLLMRVPEDAVCDGSPCVNAGLVVIAQRFTVGATGANGIAPSSLGMPINIDNLGNHLDFYNDIDARATVSNTLADLQQGIQDNEVVYAMEVLHKPGGIIYLDGMFAPEVMYSKAAF